MKPANYAPVYAAALYPQWAEIAREHGYALAVHGSLARDFDLICIPWIDRPAAPEVVLAAITSQFAARLIGGPPSIRPHGRIAYTLSIGFGECAVDMQFMLRREDEHLCHGTGGTARWRHPLLGKALFSHFWRAGHFQHRGEEPWLRS